MKRDRHGLLREQLPDDLFIGITDDLPEGVTADDLAMARMGANEIRFIAGSVFQARNAQFVRSDEKVREKLKAAMRPPLLRALGHGKNMRSALLRQKWREAVSEYRAAGIELRDAEAAIRDAERPTLMIGKRRRQQVRDFQKKSVPSRIKYTDKDRENWRRLAEGYPHIPSKRRKAELIQRKLHLPLGAIESIRKAL